MQICEFLKKRVIEDKIEIIESTSNRGLLARYAKSKDRPPICTRVSTTMASSYRNAKLAASINYRIESRYEYQQIMRSDTLVTHSKGHSKELEKELGINGEMIKPIPIGIPIPNSITDNSDRAPNNAKVHVLFVGRLERRKGIEVLLKAIPLVLKSKSFLAFTIIGSDPTGFRNSLLEYPELNKEYISQAKYLKINSL